MRTNRLRQPKRFTRPLVEPLEMRALLTITAQLLADVNTKASDFQACCSTEIGNTAYLSVNDGIHGYELWRTDGTGAGTSLVSDIYPGAASASIDSLVNIGGTLYFSAHDGVHGRELWKSDGAANGTSLVKDINPDQTSFDSPHFLTAAGSLLFFGQITKNFSYELWKSDGTAGGTQAVVAANGQVVDIRGPAEVLNGTLYFFGRQDSGNTSLWKSDGTPAGTVSIKEVSGLPNLVQANGTLYFLLSNQLWKSDGTAAGTVPFATMMQDGEPANANFLTAAGAKLYFYVASSDFGPLLWKSDGTAGGTGPLLVNGEPVRAQNITAVGSTLYFNASLSGFLILAKTDGTSAGTITLKDFSPAFFGYGFVFPKLGQDINGELYFMGQDDANGFELWKSDGTVSGTRLVKDIRSGTANSVPGPLGRLGDRLLFLANGGEHGLGLWISDGTAIGTTRIPMQTATAGSSPANLSTAGEAAYFSATDAAGVRGLWRTEGAPQSTALLQAGLDLRSRVYQAGGTVLFAAKDSTAGDELWKTDGTAAGAARVADLCSGIGDATPRNFTAIGSTMYFTANDCVAGNELWKTDGTATGTKLVKDIVSGSTGSAPSNLAKVNGTLFFLADRRLWKSDGTETGTVLVKNLSSVMLQNDPGDAVAVNSNYYFRPNRSELWQSDGTEAGTLRVASFGGVFGEPIWQLTNLNGKLLFSAFTSDYGNELWTVDGPLGVHQVLNINSSPNVGSGPSQLTVIGSTLYFTADDGVHGRELWKSDGTAAGTRMVADLAPGASSSLPENLVAANGRLVFSLDDGVHGAELWHSDGTAAGTRLRKDIIPGPAGIAPQTIAPLGGGVVFSADDSLHGREIWSALESNVAPTFVKGPDQSVSYKSGSRSVGWATSISAGAADELDQALSFLVTNDNNSLFAVQPAVNPAGQLTFRPALGQTGTANVSVTLKDSGGTINGGQNESPTRTFSITVRPPGPKHHLAKPLDVTGDNKVVARDALEVINFLNAFGARAVDLNAPSEPDYWDVSGDDFIAPGDALEVINFINAFGPDGDGEAEDATSDLYFAELSASMNVVEALAAAYNPLGFPTGRRAKR